MALSSGHPLLGTCIYAYANRVENLTAIESFAKEDGGAPMTWQAAQRISDRSCTSLCYATRHLVFGGEAEVIAIRPMQSRG